MTLFLTRPWAKTAGRRPLLINCTLYTFFVFYGVVAFPVIFVKEPKILQYCFFLHLLSRIQFSFQHNKQSLFQKNLQLLRLVSQLCLSVLPLGKWGGFSNWHSIEINAEWCVTTRKFPPLQKELRKQHLSGLCCLALLNGWSMALSLSGQKHSLSFTLRNIPIGKTADGPSTG